MDRNSSAARLLLRPQHQQNAEVPLYRWCGVGANGELMASASGSLDDLLAVPALVDLPVWLIVPGALITSRRISVSREEQRHLRRLAPFQLEDQVAADIEDLHIVCGPAVNGEVTLACICREWLQQHYSALRAAQLDIACCVPEPLALPLVSDGWSCWLDEGQVQVRCGEYQGFGVDQALAPAALELALADAVPESVELRAPSRQQLQQLQDLLPESLQAKVGLQQCCDQWTVIAGPAAAIELSQGEFARRWRWRPNWLQWRSAVGLGVLVLVLSLLLNGTAVQQARQQQQRLQSAIEQAYRQVQPQGMMVEPVRQLRHQLSLRQGGAQPSRVLPMLATLLPVLAANDGVTLKTLTYNDARGELRLNIDARSFKQIESLRAAISREGLLAELVSANVSNRRSGEDADGQHQARLKVIWN